jgi:hypothetical protein
LSCRGRFREHKVGKVLKQPFVLERSIDDSRKFTSQGDDRFPGPAAFLFFLAGIQVGTLALCGQGALHQRGSAQLGLAFGNPAGVFRLIRVADCWYDPKVSGSLPSSEKSPISPMIGSRMAALNPPIPLMLVRFLSPSSFRPSWPIVSSKSAMLPIRAAYLIDEDLQLQIHQRVKPHQQNSLFFSAVRSFTIVSRDIGSVHSVENAILVESAAQRQGNGMWRYRTHDSAGS